MARNELTERSQPDAGQANPDWWERAGTIASIVSSVVIAGVGLLLTSTFQKAQLGFTDAQLRATQAKDEYDRKDHEVQRASELFPHLFSKSPDERKLAIKLVRHIWNSPDLDDVLAELATSDDSSKVRKAAIEQLASSSSAAAVETLTGVGLDPNAPEDERSLALASKVARITAQIAGASRSAGLIWDGAPIPLIQSGDRWEGVFQSSAGKHSYSIVVLGSPGDAWNATVGDGKSMQTTNGHLSPAGSDRTGVRLISAYGRTLSDLLGEFQRQVWCRDILSVVNKSLTDSASILGDAECSTGVNLVEAALAKSQPLDQKVRNRDSFVLGQLKAVMSDLEGVDELRSMGAQLQVCHAVKDQADIYSFCPDSGQVQRSAGTNRETYPDLYRKIINGL